MLKKMSRRRFLASTLAATPLVAGADAAWWEPEWLKVRTLTLPKDQDKGAQASSGGRLVQFTDLHYKGDRSWLQKVVRTINELEPTAVCFTGDLVEKEEFVTGALRELKQIQAPLYGVPGNHDHWAGVDFDEVSEAFAATGGRWLMDEAVTTRDGRYHFMGCIAEGHAPHQFAPHETAKNVVLCHYPLWVELLGKHRFDLILAGHSHGGQVRIPFYGAVTLPFNVGKYELGLYETAAGPLYVNAGIGYIVCNIRFRCRPELTLIQL